MNCFKKARKAANMTQKELSGLIHVSQGSISQWETGTTAPDIRTLVALADIYHITLDELLNRNSDTIQAKPEEPELTQREKRLVSDFRSLNNQGKEYILQTMDMAVKIYEKDAGISDMEVVSK